METVYKVMRLTSLADLGFAEGVTVEVIASTVSSEGRANLSAMGATLASNYLALRPFKETSTYLNLASTREVVLNITDDPAFFAYAALKIPCVVVELEPSKTVRPPRLRGAQGFIEAKVEDVGEGEGGRALVKCRPLLIEAGLRPAKAYCRAPPAVIEAIVHASRIEAYVKQGAGVEELIKLIEHYRRLVGRVAPNTQYQEVVEAVWRWSLSKARGARHA
ncbi:MAG: DUF447 family protein [Candidatus Nezhaarchaeota archaeon]|nr:DUF447 family protein [Candidatus Nezhaarchaeota archaeon]